MARTIMAKGHYGGEGTESKVPGKYFLDGVGSKYAQRILCFLPGTKPTTNLAHLLSV